MLYDFFKANLTQVMHAWPHIVSLGSLFLVINVYLLKTARTRHRKMTVKSLLCVLFLSLSEALILAMTLSGREPGAERHFRLQPFWSYREAFFHGKTGLGIQIISNILLFIPLGGMLPLNFRWFDRLRRAVLVCVLLSISIEIIQGVTGMGLCETDDMMGNTLGGALGFGIWKFWQCKFRTKPSKTKAPKQVDFV